MPAQRPSALQTSPDVQALPSSHVASDVGSDLQVPLSGSQKSLVHSLPSSQTTGRCSHFPVSGLQRSVVQALPSSQSTGVWTHCLPPVLKRTVPVVLPDIPVSVPPGAPM